MKVSIERSALLIHGVPDRQMNAVGVVAFQHHRFLTVREVRRSQFHRDVVQDLFQPRDI